MYISVKQLAEAINEKKHIKPDDIIKIITVKVTDNNMIDYQVLDNTGNITYYNEQSVPATVIKLINYNRPVKTWTRENRKYYQYRF